MTNSAVRAIWRFSLKQTIIGALVVGILGGITMGAYGSAIVKIYPTESSRQMLVKTLESAPALNFLSGEVKNAATPASYAIYKSLPMMVLITSIWGLVVSTRLLRGDEEDGRTELLASGVLTPRKLNLITLAGFGCSFLISFVIMKFLAEILGSTPGVNLSAAEALYMTLAVFLPGVVFIGVGVLTSQLTATRSRALLYGMVPLLIFFCIRGAGNVSEKLNWLKMLSPFGWSDLLNPVLNPHLLWALPPAIFGIVFGGLGLYFAGKRDYGASLLPENAAVKSRLYLLSSPLAFTIRLKKWTFFWWFVGINSMAILMAALAGMVSTLVDDTSSLGSLSDMSSKRIEQLFIGESFMIVALLLLAMVILEITSIRRDEAKLYLDNLLVQPVGRRRLLMGRLVIIGLMATVIAATSSFAIWCTTLLQNITFSAGDAFGCFIAVIASVLFLGGVGMFLYGRWPRLATGSMIAVVGWAFIVDIVKDLLKLSNWIEKTSILSYIPVDVSKSPNWAGISCLVVIGCIGIIFGLRAFTKRDIVGE